METTLITVTSDGHVVIPEEIRESMGIGAGAQFEVLQAEGRIELVPVRPIRELRGSLKGMDTTVSREEDRV